MIKDKFQQLGLRMIGFVLILMLLLFVTELILRSTQPAKPAASGLRQNSGTVLYSPQTRLSETIDGVPYEANINTFGFRGRNFLFSKPTDSLRIFVVGDSRIFGVGAQDSQTIPAYLQQVLQEQNIRAEVVNAGVHDSSPIDHYVNIRDIHLQYQPDLIILAVDLTDIQDDWRKESQAVVRDGNIVRFDPTYQDGRFNWLLWGKKYSALIRWIHQNYIEEPQVSFTETDPYLMLRGRDKRELIQQRFKRTEKYLDKIHSLLQENDVPLIIVMYPYGIHIDDKQWREGRREWDFEIGKKYTDYFAYSIVGQYAARNQIPFINTIAAFFKADDKKYFYDASPHFTAPANRKIAEAIAQRRDFLWIIDNQMKKQMP